MKCEKQDNFINKNVSNYSKLYQLNQHQMGQQSSVSRNQAQSARAYPTLRNQQFYNRRIQHQGLIKLRPVPFKNCIEIQTDKGSLFLQNIQITLKDLLQSRLYTNKLFPKEDIERLIQNVTYTLAFLSDNGIPYKDVSSQNIFYDEGAFKLLPNELIAESRYQKFITHTRTRKPIQHSQTQPQFIPLSPQMIIAYRCKQAQITDIDIIDKSNVFYLGMLLLEATTLLPAQECYDIESCDILDEVIGERIQLVKEYYSDEIAAIVANLLDYDYVERLTLKEASIFVNRELNRDLTLNSKISRDLSNKKPKQQTLNSIHINDEPICSDPMADDTEPFPHHSQVKSTKMCKSRIQNSQVVESRISKPSASTIEKKKNKTNKIYMNGGVQEPEQQSVSFSKEEKNKVYMRQNSQQQEIKRQAPNQSQIQPHRSTTPMRQQNFSQSQVQPQRPTTPLRQNQNTSNTVSNQSSSLRPPGSKLLNVPSQQRLTPSIPAYTPKPNLYQASNQEDQENNYLPQAEDYTQQRHMKSKKSTDYLGYRVTPASNTMIKTQKQERFEQQPQSQFEYQDYEQKAPQSKYTYHQNSRQESDYSYPTKSAFGQRFNERESSLNEDSGSKGYFEGSKTMANNSKPSNNTDFRGQDNSLNRIKSQIQRSRKLIEEFKRGQAAQY